VSISSNINQVQDCIKVWPANQDQTKEARRRKRHRVKEQLEPSVEKLSAIQDKFKAVREEALALRDGMSTSKSLSLEPRHINNPLDLINTDLLIPAL
jgi:hypothetical protein